ncbi:hypothetical protein K438DRAFT_1963803 [Mycena galopus ATCC 62051]|nr:hypothetical protein K438DRAFT_1963803 [Mycena galopus ATCC 62051]
MSVGADEILIALRAPRTANALCAETMRRRDRRLLLASTPTHHFDLPLLTVPDPCRNPNDDIPRHPRPCTDADCPLPAARTPLVSTLGLLHNRVLVLRPRLRDGRLDDFLPIHAQVGGRLVLSILIPPPPLPRQHHVRAHLDYQGHRDATRFLYGPRETLLRAYVHATGLDLSLSTAPHSQTQTRPQAQAQAHSHRRRGGFSSLPWIERASSPCTPMVNPNPSFRVLVLARASSRLSPEDRGASERSVHRPRAPQVAVKLLPHPSC